MQILMSHGWLTVLILLTFCTGKGKQRITETTITPAKDTIKLSATYNLLSLEKIGSFTLENGKGINTGRSNKFLQKHIQYTLQALSKITPKADVCKIFVRVDEAVVKNVSANDSMKVFRYVVDFLNPLCAKNEEYFSEKPILKRLVSTEVYPMTCYYFPHEKGLLLLSHYGAQEEFRGFDPTSLHLFLNDVFKDEKN